MRGGREPPRFSSTCSSRAIPWNRAPVQLGWGCAALLVTSGDSHSNNPDPEDRRIDPSRQRQPWCDAQGSPTPSHQAAAADSNKPQAIDRRFGLFGGVRLAHIAGVDRKSGAYFGDVSAR